MEDVVSRRGARDCFQWGGTFSALCIFLFNLTACFVAESQASNRQFNKWNGGVPFCLKFLVLLAFVLHGRFLLILNRIGRRSPSQTTILFLYLFTSFPTVLFKILRGEFGCWIAFLAIAGNLFFPQTFPVSRFILFVVTPDWVANGLRDSIVGVIFCLIIGIILVTTELREIGDWANCQCSWHCFFYYLAVGLLFFFAIWYLCLGDLSV